jgi:hypothetical protein
MHGETKNDCNRWRTEMFNKDDYQDEIDEIDYLKTDISCDIDCLGESEVEEDVIANLKSIECLSLEIIGKVKSILEKMKEG